MRTPTAVAIESSDAPLYPSRAELADRLLDERGLAPLPARARHRLYSQVRGRPRRGTGREPSHVRRQVAPTGPASDGVSPRSARASASNHVGPVLVEQLRHRLLHPARTGPGASRLPPGTTARRTGASRPAGPAAATTGPSASPDRRPMIAIGTSPTPSSSAQPRRPVTEPLHVPVRRARPLREHDDATSRRRSARAPCRSRRRPPRARSIGNAPYTSAVNAWRHHTSKK